MADDGDDRDKNEAPERAVKLLGQTVDKAKTVADSLKKHEGSRAVEAVVHKGWVLVVKTVAFWITFMLITVVGSTTLALSAVISETLKEVNQIAPGGKLVLLGGWAVIALIISFFFAISHNGRPAFYYTRVGLIVGLVVNFLVTISPLGYLFIRKFL